MARPMNKKQLIEFTENEFKRIIIITAQLSEDQRDHQFIFDNRTAKDIVAHVYAWQLLELDWYTQGMEDKKPKIPAPGYTFKDSPALNEKLYQEYKDMGWENLLKEFTNSHNKLLSLVKNHSEDELYTKKKYTWTGSTDMATYFRSALWSHYIWAIDLIRKYFKISIK